jgi:two-component system chemotaxis response regulator CheB
MIAEPTLRSSPEMAVRDIVVIGCSAGGVEALPRILQQLPGDVAAAIFIVQHLAPTGARYLAGILDRLSELPVAWAEQGDEVKPGRVLVAPPDVHLMLYDGHVHLNGGARENHSRPSIDKLFRSAAASYGSRVIGALLTGMLDDGVAGLCAIRDAGGTVIVQDPKTAAFPEMPSRALHAVRPDKVLPLDEIGTSIFELVGKRVGVAAIPAEVALEAEIDRETRVPPERLARLGAQATITCPECSGPTWQIGGTGSPRYRCYLGHVTSARDLLDTSTANIESALWSAVRALNDRATALDALAGDASRIGSGQSSEQYANLAREARQQATLARQFMLDLGRAK